MKQLFYLGVLLVMSACQSGQVLSREEVLDVHSQYENFSTFGINSVRCDVGANLQIKNKANLQYKPMGTFEFVVGESQPRWSKTTEMPSEQNLLEASRGATQTLIALYFVLPEAFKGSPFTVKSDGYHTQDRGTEIVLSKDFKTMRMSFFDMKMDATYERSPRNKMRPTSYKISKLQGMLATISYNDSKEPYLFSFIDLVMPPDFVKNDVTKTTFRYSNCEVFK